MVIFIFINKNGFNKILTLLFGYFEIKGLARQIDIISMLNKMKTEVDLTVEPAWTSIAGRLLSPVQTLR